MEGLCRQIIDLVEQHLSTFYIYSLCLNLLFAFRDNNIENI